MFSIDKIYCINLDSRTDRWDKMDEQFKALNLPVERISAHTGSISDPNPFRKTLGQLGCLKSHRSVIEDAKANGYKQILVFEDDITFCPDFNERLKIFSESIPSNWECAYLGGTIFGHEPFTVSKYISKNIGTTYGAFAIIIKDTIYDELLRLYDLKAHNVDNCFAKLQPKHNMYIFKPFFVYVNYDTSNVIEGEKLTESMYNRIHQYYKDSI